jgi:dihydroxy-acid dehydratase
MKRKRQRFLRITAGTNPYHDHVQGKANEPICVLNLLLRASKEFGIACNVTQDEIVERLDENAPRVAIITGSPDQPAHVVDYETSLKAAVAIWKRGGVPFSFGVPVMCDGTAQSNTGMCYSLESRNLVTRMVVNQMESHAYHGAFVIQGCDKTPFAIVCALAALDRSRQARGEAPVFATFAPAHVLRGGVIPEDVKTELEALAVKAEKAGHEPLANDLRLTMDHILQCTSNQAFQGVFTRLVHAQIMTAKNHKDLEKRLAANTCHINGGICAFNGTGNSSRHAVSALGLVHPALELLTDPPSLKVIDAAVQAMFTVCQKPDYSVANLLKANKENLIRIHSTTGGSTNLMMHIVAAMVHAGEKFSIHDYDKIRRKVTIPDLMNYSLTEGRDIYALAKQSQSGKHAGMETVLYELQRNGIPVSLDAPTMAGYSWAMRMNKRKKLAANHVKKNPILLAFPRRATSGIDVLKGNFFESAVVKISGMPEEQIAQFDNTLSVVLYFENEDEAVASLLDNDLLHKLAMKRWISREVLLQIHKHNTGRVDRDLPSISCRRTLFRRVLEDGAFRMSIVIAGQGPEAYGMPEMFTPMQHLNHNQELKKLCTLISDGRYSGVSYGAAIGHVTPEAYRQGGILYLQSGDVLHLRLRKKTIHLLDMAALLLGKFKNYSGDLSRDRKAVGTKRLKNMLKRRGIICPTNGLRDVTDAAHGVVPTELWDWAT